MYHVINKSHRTQRKCEFSDNPIAIDYLRDVGDFMVIRYKSQLLFSFFLHSIQQRVWRAQY